jgi:hypothetical protein
MEYEQKLQGILRFASDAMAELVRNNKALFQSFSEKAVAQHIIAQIRLNAESIPTPSTPQECVELLEMILGKVLSEGILPVPSYGLSKQGRAEYDKLVSLFIDGRPPAPDPMEAVIDLFNANKNDFMVRRAQDENFRVLSDQALAAGRLR